ncbi:MAG TPA: ADP compounds hydrolase NudE [Thiothrix sp.]|nr:ADP compounds hydrolase NudE [Thiothrix sp.]
MPNQKSKYKKPTIHQKQIVASSRLFNIEQLDLEFSNGEQRQYERLVSRGNGAVLIVPMLDDDTVLLIREYAGGTNRYELGLPKGKVEEGEAILHAANREIMEEVGYESASLTHIKAVSLAPQYMQHHTQIVLAQELSPRREEGDEPEELEVVPWKLSNLEALLGRDDFSEARSIVALFMVRNHLSNFSS